MSRIGAIRAFAAAALVAAATACTDSTGPQATSDFDPAAATADHRAMDAVFESSGWASLRTLGDREPFAGIGSVSVGAGALVDASRRLAAEDDPRAFAAELMRRVAATERPSRGPIISDRNRGVTFVWDAGAGRYVPDPDRPGAPPNGVRFVLYEESGGHPDPAREIGYADLIDEGDGSAEDVALRLVCVQRDRTVVDYRTTVDETGQGGRVTVEGFLQGDDDRLRFDIDVRGHGEHGPVDVDFEMGIDDRDFEIAGSVRGAGDGDGPGAIDVAVRHGGDSLRVDVANTGASLRGTFYVDGDVFATVSGDPDEPTFTSADGDPLTTLEVGVLIYTVGVVEVALGLFQGLVAPVAGLVALGIVL